MGRTTDCTLYTADKFLSYIMNILNAIITEQLSICDGLDLLARTNSMRSHVIQARHNLLRIQDELYSYAELPGHVEENDESTVLESICLFYKLHDLSLLQSDIIKLLPANRYRKYRIEECTDFFYTVLRTYDPTLPEFRIHHETLVLIIIAASCFLLAALILTLVVLFFKASHELEMLHMNRNNLNIDELIARIRAEVLRLARARAVPARPPVNRLDWIQDDISTGANSFGQ